MMTKEAKAKREAQVAKITKALRAMKVGFCGVKFDCLVWRVSKEAFAVGSTSISIDETDDIETASRIIEALQSRVAA